MPVAKIETRFNPESIKLNKRGETTMYLTVTSEDQKVYWCECDIVVSPPMSLAHDKELNIGRTRVGILSPKKKIEKQIKLFSQSANIITYHPINITTYLYDEDGAIAERFEQSESIKSES
jgi:hypothetical protein